MDTQVVSSKLTRAHVVAAVRCWIGTPYHHQASLRGVGADCLGLVRGVWRELYGRHAETPPAYSRDWAESAARETLLDAACRHLDEVSANELAPGNVVIFRFRPRYPAKHLGIFVGQDRMVHAFEGHGTAEVELAPWWRRRIAGVFDFPGLEN